MWNVLPNPTMCQQHLLKVKITLLLVGCHGVATEQLFVGRPGCRAKYSGPSREH